MDSHSCLDLPFDQYQRYAAIRESIVVLRPGDGPILDVGGYSRLGSGEDYLLLQRFLPGVDVVVLDRYTCSQSGYLQGDGLALPFADASFPVVVSVDALEHIAPQSRRCFWNELLRVTRDYLILAAPFDDDQVTLAEQLVYEFTALVHGVGHPQIGEHLANGLPDLLEAHAILVDAGWCFVEIPNGYIYNWLLMMALYNYLLSIPGAASLSRMVNRFYNNSFFESDHRLPAYRRILVAARHRESQALLDRVKARFADVTTGDQGETLVRLSLFQLLMKVVALKLHNQALQEKERENAALRELVRRYEQGRFIRMMAWLDRLKRHLLHPGG
jgi:hypothetical protein